MKSKVNTYKNKAKKTAVKVKDTAISSVKKTADLAVKNPVKTAYVVGAVIGIYLLYRIANSASNAVSDVLEPDDIDTNIEGTGGKVDKNKITITPFQARNFAQQLLDAMNVKQPLYGTDEKTIEAIFDTIQTPSDFIAIYNEFGLREYNGNNSPPKSAFWQWFDEYRPQNLVYWLKSEIDPKDDKRVYEKIKRIVEPAGFAF